MAHTLRDVTSTTIAIPLAALLATLAQRTEGRIQVLTKKPLTPQPDELERNPRARSAKLRAAECTG